MILNYYFTQCGKIAKSGTFLIKIRYIQNFFYMTKKSLKRKIEGFISDFRQTKTQLNSFKVQLGIQWCTFGDSNPGPTD